jgi:O-antigen/teichoic acid export membrane protein
VRRRKYTLLSKRTISYSVAQAGTTVGLGLLGLRPVGLMLGTCAAQAVGTLTIARKLLRQDRALFPQVSLSGMWRMAHRYLRFPLLSSRSGLINSAGSVVPLLLISRYYGATVAGLYVLTARVDGAPSAVVSESVAQVYLGEVATLARRDLDALRRLFIVSLRRLLAVGALATLAVALPAPILFPAVLGERWHEAGWYAVMLVTLYVGQFVANPLSSTLAVFERQDIQLTWDCIRLVCGVACVIVPVRLGASVLVTIGVFGAVSGALYAVLVFMTFRAVRSASSVAG